MSWDVQRMANQEGKLVLVTGANSGIGFEAAKELAGKGAEVVLACRNIEKGGAAISEIKASYPSAKVSLMALDLASLESVNTFVADFTQQYQKLDVLINNAGVMAPPLAKTADNFEMQFGTNHLGHFALTGKLLSLLEAAESGRVVVVSSVAHRIGRINFANLNAEKNYFRWTAYGQSKLANLMFAKELQRRLSEKGSKVIAVAVHPGYSTTNLQRHTMGGSFINRVALRIIAQSQPEGALPTLYGATEPGLKGGEYIGPDGFMELKGRPASALVAKQAKNESVAQQLWDVSESLTDVHYLSAS
ncbi:MAG: oxidoreductase [Pseudomonadales bacterium]|nr:oxidoreductase [Pseudomonadales bacterium]